MTPPQHPARWWILGTAGALILVIAGLVIANLAFQRRIVRDIETDQVAATTQRRLTEWAIAAHESGLADEVVRLARSADLKEALAGGGREALRDQLEPALNRLRRGPLAISRITLFDADGRLRVHAHGPEDAASPFDQRQLLLTAMRERRIVKGVEIIDGVPHILAASPIYQDGTLVGLLEAGTSMAPITRSLRSVTGAHVALRLTDGRVVEASSPGLITDALRKIRPASEASRHVVQNDTQRFVVSLVPVTSFSGDVVGHLTLLFDTSRTIATLEASNTVAFVIAFLGCGVAGGLLLLLSRRLTRVYARLAQLHATAQEHRERAERRAERLAAVSVMTRSIASAETPEQAASAVASAAESVLGAALTRIWIEGPEAGVLVPAFAWGTAADNAGDVLPIAVGRGLVGKVFESKTVEYRVDIQEEPEWLSRRFVRDAALHAYAGLPLLARGCVQGVMSLLFTDRREFTPEEKDLMQVLADSVAIALERSRAAAPSPVA